MVAVEVVSMAAEDFTQHPLEGSTRLLLVVAGYSHPQAGLLLGPAAVLLPPGLLRPEERTSIRLLPQGRMFTRLLPRTPLWAFREDLQALCTLAIRFTSMIISSSTDALAASRHSSSAAASS